MEATDESVSVLNAKMKIFIVKSVLKIWWKVTV